MASEPLNPYMRDLPLFQSHTGKSCTHTGRYCTHTGRYCMKNRQISPPIS
jgi:hypothetical protein